MRRCRAAADAAQLARERAACRALKFSPLPPPLFIVVCPISAAAASCCSAAYCFADAQSFLLRTQRRRGRRR